jgi:ribosomal protein L11 methyltransferase
MSTQDPSSEDLPWWRGEFLAAESELSSDLLWSLGAGGVEIRDHDTFFEGDPDFAPIPDGKVRLIAYFACAKDDVDVLREGLQTSELVEVVALVHYEDRSWETKWHEFFTPRLLAPHTIVGPPWEEFDAPEGGRKLIIEPGMAFGTGTHETTQLVSTQLEALLEGGHEFERMLDVGCGSGILCTLANQMGVKHLTGLELQEDTLENAHKNVSLNALDPDAFTFSTTPLDRVEGAWPLVVANIIAPILLELCEQLIAHTKPGGTLVLSGILAEQMPAIRAAFSPHMQEVSEAHLGLWHAIHYKRPLTTS